MEIKFRKWVYHIFFIILHIDVNMPHPCGELAGRIPLNSLACVTKKHMRLENKSRN
jgi:hypothetical protein